MGPAWGLRWAPAGWEPVGSDALEWDPGRLAFPDPSSISFTNHFIDKQYVRIINRMSVYIQRYRITQIVEIDVHELELLFGFYPGINRMLRVQLYES